MPGRMVRFTVLAAVLSVMVVATSAQARDRMSRAIELSQRSSLRWS